MAILGDSDFSFRVYNLRVKYNLMYSWAEAYALAERYSTKHGNLNISNTYKTLNGYEENKHGLDLGKWVRKQIIAKKKGKLTASQIELLDAIGIDKVKIRRLATWMDYYELVLIYYRENGNIKMRAGFRTKDGITYDSKGLKIYQWIVKQRKRKDKLTPEQIKLLDDVEMNWEQAKKLSWMDYYKLAREYSNFYHNLNIPNDFKTKNGIDYDPDGYNLGSWLNRQKQLYKGRIDGKLTIERIKLLEEIGIVWYTNDQDILLQAEKITHYNKYTQNRAIQNRFYSVLSQYDGDTLPSKEELNYEFVRELVTGKECNNILTDEDKTWMKGYNYATKYRTYHGDLVVVSGFKTKNGYKKNPNGFNLDWWLDKQRRLHRKLPRFQIKLLNRIDIPWNKGLGRWLNQYKIVLQYFKQNGHLYMPYDYVIVNLNLSKWVSTQRSMYFTSPYELLPIQRRLLEEIGIQLPPYWQKMYSLAKKYREHYNNLNISIDFKTIDGINPNSEGEELGSWMDSQRHDYDNNIVLSEKQRTLLEEIGINEVENSSGLVSTNYEDIDVSKSFKTLGEVKSNSNKALLESSDRKDYKSEIGHGIINQMFPSTSNKIEEEPNKRKIKSLQIKSKQ